MRPRDLGWLEAPPALASASPAVRELVLSLVAVDPVTRTRGLDGIPAVLNAAPSALAPEALAYLLPLAMRRGYPASSALLARLFAIFASIDDPPRSGSGPVHDAFRHRSLQLLRHARTARDPAAARLAAVLCARFPALDDEVAPLLVALLTGTADPDERGRLLYALVRIEATRGGRFHARVAEVLHRNALDAEKVAVAMALAQHDPPEPLRGRLVEALRAACELRGISDPRSWGRALEPSTIERCLTTLQARRGG